jgi:hypothetical protein
MDKTPTAFPWTHDNITCTGMTLRDYFAAKAMQAFISAYPCQAIDGEDGGIPTDAESISGDAYEMADAMMKAREA